MGVVVKPRFYSLFIVCFTVYCVSCDSSSSSSSSFEDRTLPAEESYEQTDDRSLRYDDDGSDSFEAKRVGNRAGVDGHATEDHQVKRFLVPFSLTAAGLDMSGNRPSMFMHQQQQQHQQPRYQNHKQQQQQQQQQQQHHHNQQQQHQRQHPPPQQQHSNLQHHRQQQQQQHHRQQQQQQQQQKQQQGQMSAGVDHNDFGPSDSGESGGFDDPSSDGFYQQGGSSGGEALNFETTGFADFVPSTGYHSPGTPTMPAPPSFSQFSASPPSLLTSSPFSVGPSQLQSSPFGDGNGGGSSGQLFDTAGFDQKSALMSVGGGGRGADVGSAGYNYASQSPVVHKSVYVHVAPPDDDEPPRKQRVIVPNVPPKKNYQIVFIKAPTAPPLVAPIIPPPPPQHSDKTLIYVLHPKQEDAPPIHIPPPPETPPLKPEVYFIKYKNRGEEPPTGGDGDEYGSDHGGGVLSSPADEFNDVSDGYPHRRYGRGDKTHEPSATSPSVLTTAVGRDDDVRGGGGGGGEDEDGVTSSEQRERVAAVDREHEDFETTASDPTTKATVRSSVDDELLQHRDGYSGEYNDASVDSSNVNEMHVQQQQSVPIVAPKGKNGH